MNVAKYPLQWPVRVPRTKASDRTGSQFGKRGWDRSIDDLERELHLLGADDAWIISTNQPIRKDGYPFAQDRRIDDPGVAVYFALRGKKVCFPCDRWATIAENLRAVTLHIEAMRGQTRWGVGTIDQAFAGYAALPASTEENWWDVLGLSREGLDRDDIEYRFKLLAKAAHPDTGGSTEAMARLNGARDRAIAEIAA